MAACPYCKTVDGGLLKGECVRCTSPLNPGNTKRGDQTKNGVSYARCRDGKVYEGMTYRQCPFMKKAKR